MKVVINSAWGGYTLNDEVVKLYKKYGGKEKDPEWNAKRHEPALIKAIEEVKKKNQKTMFIDDLEIIEIPDGVDYEIDDYDGMESIHEKHRSWS